MSRHTLQEIRDWLKLTQAKYGLGIGLGQDMTAPRSPVARTSPAPAPAPAKPTEEDWVKKYLPPIGVIDAIIEPKDIKNG